MLVHAHPDDETVGTGATMALYAAAGVQVTLVTCTLGEEGEIHVPELALLGPAEADQLGGYRLAELDAACVALGVTDRRFLGGAGRYRDSGMMGPARQRRSPAAPSRATREAGPDRSRSRPSEYWP
jgi:N-acetyl-1-D-myo-inositol-2-amino-2-deoxy-alpha-D-glucopyranoside deacetylase